MVEGREGEGKATYEFGVGRRRVHSELVRMSEPDDSSPPLAVKVAEPETATE